MPRSRDIPGEFTPGLVDFLTFSTNFPRNFDDFGCFSVQNARFPHFFRHTVAGNSVVRRYNYYGLGQRIDAFQIRKFCLEFFYFHQFLRSDSVLFCFVCLFVLRVCVFVCLSVCLLLVFLIPCLPFALVCLLSAPLDSDHCFSPEPILEFMGGGSFFFFTLSRFLLFLAVFSSDWFCTLFCLLFLYTFFVHSPPTPPGKINGSDVSIPPRQGILFARFSKRPKVASFCPGNPCDPIKSPPISGGRRGFQRIWSTLTRVLWTTYFRRRVRSGGWLCVPRCLRQSRARHQKHAPITCKFP